MAPDADVQDEINWAVELLAGSERGRSALKHLLAWLDDDGLGLDQRNQDAATCLLTLAWQGCAGSVRDAMRLVVDEHCEHQVRDGDWCDECNADYKQARTENADTDDHGERHGLPEVACRVLRPRGSRNGTFRRQSPRRQAARAQGVRSRCGGSGVACPFRHSRNTRGRAAPRRTLPSGRSQGTSRKNRTRLP